MNILFQIDGGLGKNIMATAIIKVIRKHYKDAHIVIITGYPDVFLNNPNINECFQFDQIKGSYLKYIKYKNCKNFLQNN